MEPLATVDDVRAYSLRGIPESQTAFVEAKLAAAQALLLTECPWLERPGLPQTLRDNARIVLAEAVNRVLRNPNGMRTETTASGFSYGRFDHDDGTLFFTSKELAMLALPKRQFRGFGVARVRPWLS